MEVRRLDGNIGHLVFVGLAALIMQIAVPATAAPPWQKLIPFRPVSEQSEPSSLELTEANGPWMIFAAAFRGPGAEKDARTLALELTQRYGLEAYIHHKHFDFTEPVEGLHVDPFNRPKRMRYMHGTEFDEYAVLVGNFSSIDDPVLQETLESLKYAQPKCLSGESATKSTLRFAVLRNLQKKISGDEEKKRKGPLGNAFVTRNPLLPAEYFAPQGVDRLVLEMNQDKPYSLLECPGKYTVRVATFSGDAVIDQRKVQEIEEGRAQLKSRLEEAGEKAYKLTLKLRKNGIEAYQFHDRHESIVTVGSFDRIGTMLPNGRIDLDPMVEEVIEFFSPEPPKAPPGMPQASVRWRPKELAGIRFDAQPLPMPVPRRSVAADYANHSR